MNKIQAIIQKCISEGIKPKTCSACLGKKVVKDEPCLNCAGTGNHHSKWYRIHQSALELQEQIDQSTAEVKLAQEVFDAEVFTDPQHELQASSNLEDMKTNKRNAIKPRIVYLLKLSGLI